VKSELEELLLKSQQHEIVDLSQVFNNDNSSGVDAQVIIECSGTGARMRFVDLRSGRVIASSSATLPSGFPKGSWSYEQGIREAARTLAGVIVPIRHCGGYAG
jgi:hypothetical protein